MKFGNAGVSFKTGKQATCNMYIFLYFSVTHFPGMKYTLADLQLHSLISDVQKHNRLHRHRNDTRKSSHHLRVDWRLSNNEQNSTTDDQT